MKNIFQKFLCLLCTIVMFPSCYDDSGLRSTLDDYGKRISALENLCKEMNTNISSLQTIVNALQNNDYVTGVTPIMQGTATVGYTISFSKSNSINIYHGTKGTDGKDGINGNDGNTPLVSIKKFSDGNWYWTLDGDWILDGNGNKVRANGYDGENGADGQNGKDGITPQLKIEDGYWHISYDDGVSWTRLGKAVGDDGKDGEDGDSMFSDVRQDENNVYLTLRDGVVITIPKAPRLSILLDVDPARVNISAGETITINYELVNHTTNPIVTASSDGRYIVDIVRENSSKGKLIIKVPSPVVNGYVNVIATDDSRQSAIRVINFNERSEIILSEGYTYYASYQAQNISIPFRVNCDYVAAVDDGSKGWLSVSEATKTFREEVLIARLEKNDTGSDRSGTICIIDSEDNSEICQLTIIQYSDQTYIVGNGYRPDTERYGDFTLADGVLFIDDKLESFVFMEGNNLVISKHSADTRSMIVQGNFPQDLIPAVGEVIFIPLSEKFPEGFMGRVVSVLSDGNNVRLEMEDAELTDVFEDLDLKMENVDLGERIICVEDEDGNLLTIEDVDASEWDAVYEGEEGDVGMATRTEKEKKRATKKIDIKKKGFEGYILGEFAVSPELHIHRGKMIYNVETEVKVGLHLGAELQFASKEIDIPFGEPKILPINFGDLIVLKPYVVLSGGLEISGDISMKAGLDILALYERTVISNESGEQTITKESLAKTPAFRWEVDYLDMDLSMGIYFATAIEYGFAKEDIFAIGLEAKTKFTTEAEMTINSNDEKLLEVDPVISFGPSMELTAYAKWYDILKNKTEKKSTKPLVQVGKPIIIHLLPNFKNLRCKKEHNSIKVSGDLSPRSFLTSKERGFALCDKKSDKPIKHLPCYTSYVPETSITSNTAKPVDDIYDEVEFTGLANPEEYEVKAYVVAEEGKQYYLPITDTKVTSEKADQINVKSAVLHGSFAEIEKDDISWYGFEIANNPNMSNSAYKGVDANYDGRFSTKMTCLGGRNRLKPETTYYWRAFVQTTDKVYHYGEVKNFITLPEPQTEIYQSLKKFYETANGDNWFHNDNWLDGEDYESWYGIIPEGKDNLFSLNIYNNNVSGNIILQGIDILCSVGLMDDRIQSITCDNCQQLKGVGGKNTIIIDNCQQVKKVLSEGGDVIIRNNQSSNIQIFGSQLPNEQAINIIFINSKYNIVNLEGEINNVTPIQVNSATRV